MVVVSDKTVKAFKTAGIILDDAFPDTPSDGDKFCAIGNKTFYQYDIARNTWDMIEGPEKLVALIAEV